LAANNPPMPPPMMATRGRVCDIVMLPVDFELPTPFI
jgi:hypothetical protein